VLIATLYLNMYSLMIASFARSLKTARLHQCTLATVQNLQTNLRKLGNKTTSYKRVVRATQVDTYRENNFDVSLLRYNIFNFVFLSGIEHLYT